MQHDVFISYSSHDKEAAQAICHVLEENGIRCWMAPRDIPYGSQYGDIIDDAIKECKVLVVVFSEKASSSPWVNGELNVAFEEQKTIIPFRLDETPLKGQTRVMLNQKHWIDAYPDYKIKFGDLVSAVAGAVGKTINSSESKEPVVRHGSLNKLLFVILTAVAIIAATIFLMSTLRPFKYDRIGIKTTIKSVGKEQEKALKDILDNMMLIQGGTFIMGNDYSKPELLTDLDSLSINPHSVTLSKYYISRYELTVDQWNAFARDAGLLPKPEFGLTAAEGISWDDAQMFIQHLSKITQIDFSLPTEAQWEFAAGAGGNRNYPYAGSGEESFRYIAWSSADNIKSAAIVGTRQPNDLGLHDMTGNVSEWCIDCYDVYPDCPQVNPCGPQDKVDKIYRGGSYLTPNFQDMKVTSRYFAAPFVNLEAIGIRLVINVR